MSGRSESQQISQLRPVFGVQGPALVRFVFIESSIFSAYLIDYLTDDEYAKLQEYLCENPDAGDMVRGSGGVRKLRWSLPGRGKSGGVRICYYAKNQVGQIFLLTIYAKNVKESISGQLLKQIKEAMEGL